MTEIKRGLFVRTICGCQVGNLESEKEAINIVPFGFGKFDLAEIIHKCKCGICGNIPRIDRIIFRHCQFSYYMISGVTYEEVKVDPIIIRGEDSFAENEDQYAKLQFTIEDLPEGIEAEDIGDPKIKNYELRDEEFEIILPKVSEGSFGVVYKAKWKGNVGRNRIVAVKEMKLETTGENTKENIMKEFSIIMRLKYRHVIPVYGYTYPEGEGRIRIVMDLMDGDIHGHVTKRKTPLTVYEKFCLLWKMTKGLHYLHDRKVMHLDIKSYNFLQKGDGKEVVITDFGLSRPIQEQKTHETGKFGGTLLWLAPELFMDSPKYRYSSDIYSFAITIWEVLYQEIPYSDKNCPLQLVLMSLIQQGLRPNVADPGLPQEFKKLMEDGWHKDPKKRPSAEGLMEWFSQNHEMFRRKYNKAIKFDGKYKK